MGSSTSSLGVGALGGRGHWLGFWSVASCAGLVGVRRRMVCTWLCPRLVGGLWAGRLTGGVRRRPRGRRWHLGVETRCRGGCRSHICDIHWLSVP